MKNTYKLGHLRGFTLIELLVVIAIIGILASVVLASLNSARDKGEDAAVKSNINNIRPQAELIYDNAGDYAAVCADTNVSNGVTAASGECSDDANGWAVLGALNTTPVSYYCVDSTGSATTTLTDDIAEGSDYTCAND